MVGSASRLLCLLAALALLVLAAPASATDEEGRDEEEVESKLLLAKTGDFAGVLHDIGVAYTSDAGVVLDRRELSTVPGAVVEEPGGLVRHGGNVSFFVNASGNFAFADVAVGAPLMLDGRVCPNGVRTFDLLGNEQIRDAVVLSGTHVIGVGTRDGLGLVVDIDLATCALGTLLGGAGAATLDVPTTTPDRLSEVALDGDDLIVGGSSGSDALLTRVDLPTASVVGGFGTMGFVRPNPSAGSDDIRGLTITGGSIFAVGGANDGANGAVDSFVGKFDLTTGAQDPASGAKDLGGTQERLRVILPFDGDLFAAGVSSDDDNRGATLVRLNTDLSLDPACDPDGLPGGSAGTGRAFYDFADHESNLFAMVADAALFPAGTVFNDAELDDVLQMKVGPDCLIDQTFAGGASGNRIRFFFDPPPFGVIPPPSGTPPPGKTPPPGGTPTPLGGQAGAPEPAFGSHPARSFITKARPVANGVISGIELTCPRHGAAGTGERCRFDLTLHSTAVNGQAQQAAKRKKRRSVRLASGRLTVPEGSKKAARLRLTKKGKRALRRSHARSIAAKLTVKVRNNAGQRRTFTRNVKVKLKKRRR